MILPAHKHCSYQQFLQTLYQAVVKPLSTINLLTKVCGIVVLQNRAQDQQILQVFPILKSQTERKRCTLWLMDMCFPYRNAMSWISALCFASSIAAWQLFASKALCDRKTCSFHVDIPMSSVRQFCKWKKGENENTKTATVSVSSWKLALWQEKMQHVVSNKTLDAKVLKISSGIGREKYQNKYAWNFNKQHFHFLLKKNNKQNMWSCQQIPHRSFPKRLCYYPEH